MMRQRRGLILAMLLSLHLALITPADSLFVRGWLLVHFGLFLIWQPFVSAERELNVVSTTLLLGITIAILYTLAGWMLVAWISVLIAIMGGKVFTLQAAQRSRFYLVAVFYLFAILLTWTVPVSMLEIKTLPTGIRPIAALTLPFVLSAMIFLPFQAADETSTQVFDFFYSLFVFQLVVVIVLGSLAAMRITDNQYFPAVLITVFGFAAALLFLAIIWGPRAGFGGLRTYFSRYLMTVGMPFELWMRRIAELSETETSSALFLTHAMDEVARMPWVVGARWQSPDGDHQFGRESPHTAMFQHHELKVTFFTEVSLSPALFLHVRLLAQVIGEFYEGKRREQAMKANAYMQAVHETGARLTHDMKNLLQSLYTITSASVMARERGRRRLHDLFEGVERRHATEQFDQMLERQLPQLSKRLQATLDKLRNPATASTNIVIPATQWWHEVLNRHIANSANATAGAVFQADANIAGDIPANVFDSVLENCLENARKKRDREPTLSITVMLGMQNNMVELDITDSGSAIDQALVRQLFRAPVATTRIDDGAVSQGGTGIGLYQAARQASEAGYVLKLSSNEKGCVCFTLCIDQTDQPAS